MYGPVLPHSNTTYKSRCVWAEKRSVCPNHPSVWQSCPVIVVLIWDRASAGTSPCSAIQLLHDFHDNCPWACENQVAHGAVVYIQHVEPIDRDDELTDLEE
ncbi:hypothetical protein I79_025980 [Cricetulus griseus]|uniref:Uncharacterized protein n=1 Tax=Cricetulus griseus TaxID=10029 RepID=G3IPR1_CRIGR|nr:hypothetical protein I79_025980 [Cricetulus griseus]